MKMWKVSALTMVLMVTCAVVPALARGPRRAVVRGPVVRGPVVRGPVVVAPRVVYRAPVVVPRYVPAYPFYPVYRSTIVVPGSYYRGIGYRAMGPGVSIQVMRGGMGWPMGY